MSRIRWFILPLVVIVLLGIHIPRARTISDYYPPLSPTNITSEAFLAKSQTRNYLGSLGIQPEDAQYFDLINQYMTLNQDELNLLGENGFVLTDRLTYENFTRAYAWIYWRDLPVLVTTDSILHAVHETFSDLLIKTEEQVLTPMLLELLEKTRTQLRNTPRSADVPDWLYDDLDTYLSVPLRLLTGSTASDGSEVDEYVALAMYAQSVTDISLFGGIERTIDFTRFEPSGHYIESQALSQYFRAMIWLSEIDMRLLHYHSDGTPEVNLEHIAAAHLLRNAMEAAGTLAIWEQIDILLNGLLGRSDNTNIYDLEQFLSDAQLASPGDGFSADYDQLLSLLTTNDYGRQRITGQIISVDNSVKEPIERPVSFMLLGQRYAVDSYVMSNLVYDRLLVDKNKVMRAFPSTLDVMYTLGNDRAVTHLEDELLRYSHHGTLDALRQANDGYDDSVWSSGIYNQWLNMIRSLNDDSAQTHYPRSMQTAAWDDKTLHTQLASWAQLRHDTLLYVEHSYTSEPLCEYPAGYVEPYPRFYAAVAEYARGSRRLYEQLDYLPAANIRDTALDYFDHLEQVAVQLQTIAEKELAHEPLSEAEELFLKSIIIERTIHGAYLTVIDSWTGWYGRLFPWNDDDPAVIADIHSNTGILLPPQGVLHVATGHASTLIFVEDSGETPTMYVGPAFTYYEFVEEGFPPRRINDDVWGKRLAQKPAPVPPSWTQSFRLPSPEDGQLLVLPLQP